MKNLYEGLHAIIDEVTKRDVIDDIQTVVTPLLRKQNIIIMPIEVKLEPNITPTHLYVQWKIVDTVTNDYELVASIGVEQRHNDVTVQNAFENARDGLFRIMFAPAKECASTPTESIPTPAMEKPVEKITQTPSPPTADPYSANIQRGDRITDKQLEALVALIQMKNVNLGELKTTIVKRHNKYNLADLSPEEYEPIMKWLGGL